MVSERLEFDVNETKKIRQMASYYRVAKELIIYGEQIDPNNRTLAQTLSERVNALDHLMRVILEKQGLRQEPIENPAEYNRINLDKAYGHIYRTAYDALDWVGLTIQERLAQDMHSISLGTISAIFPEYFTTVKPALYKILHDDIVSLRNEKDVADVNESNLERYIQTILQLKQLFNQVDQRLPDLINYENRDKRKQWLDKVWQLGLVILAGIVGWLIGHFG